MPQVVTSTASVVEEGGPVRNQTIVKCLLDWPRQVLSADSGLVAVNGGRHQRARNLSGVLSKITRVQFNS